MILRFRSSFFTARLKIFGTPFPSHFCRIICWSSLLVEFSDTRMFYQASIGLWILEGESWFSILFRPSSSYSSLDPHVQPRPYNTSVWNIFIITLLTRNKWCMAGLSSPVRATATKMKLSTRPYLRLRYRRLSTRNMSLTKIAMRRDKFYMSCYKCRLWSRSMMSVGSIATWGFQSEAKETW